MNGMKGIAGRGAWFKAMWAWPNPPLNGVKGIVGIGACLKALWAWPNSHCNEWGEEGKGLWEAGRGLISIETEGEG